MDNFDIGIENDDVASCDVLDTYAEAGHDTPEMLLSRGADKINRLLRTIARKTLDIAAAVESLKVHMPASHLKAFLEEHCGIASSDATGYMKATEKLGKHRDVLIENGVSLQTVKSLAGSASAVVDEMIGRLELGHRLQARHVAEVKREMRLKSMHFGRRQMIERRQALKRHVSSRHSERLSALQIGVDGLLAGVEAFLLAHLPARDENEPELSKDWTDPADPVYLAAHSDLARMARDLVGTFEEIFGTEPFPTSEPATDPDEIRHRIRLSQAHVALMRIARGRFAHHGGSASDEKDDGSQYGSEELWNAVAYLSKSYYEPERASWDTRGQHFEQIPPRVVELCAGAGGQAIGLHQAGFHHAALFENNKSAVKTLRNSWPNWNVVQADISEDVERHFAPFIGIDLVAGGLPCGPFSTRGDMLGPDDPANMFPAAQKILTTVRPSAFMFENVLGFMSKKFLRYRAEVLAGFNSLGYDVAIHRINATDFGFAQDRQRIVIVGMKKGTLGRFRMPSLKEAWSVDVAETLGDLVVQYRTNPKDFGPPTLAQHAYDSWADKWLMNARGRKVPTVTRARGNMKKEDSSRWEAARLDAGSIADFSPKVGEVTGDDHVSGMTLEMLQRLQGFPKGWRFPSKGTPASLQIANAFPPRLAQAVGIALRQALRDETVDIDRELRQSFPTHRIGRKRWHLDLNSGVVPMSFKKPEPHIERKAKTGSAP